MSKEGSGSNEMLNFLGGLAAIVILVGFVLFKIVLPIIAWVWLNVLAPCILVGVFYLLPFAVTAAALGALWAGICGFIGGERRGEYRALSIAIPVTVLILYGAIGAPKDTPWVTSERPVTVTEVQMKKWRKLVPSDAVKAVNVEIAAQQLGKWHFEPIWLSFAEAYADTKRNFGLGESSLTDHDNPPYDQGSFSGVLWLAFLLGAPAIFWYLALGLAERYRKQFTVEEEARQERINNEKAASRSQSLQTIRGLEERVKAQDDELAKLRAQGEFLSKKALPLPSGAPGLKTQFDSKSSASKAASGVMDTDAL